MAEFDQTLINKFFRLGERTAVDLENPVPHLTDLSQLVDPTILGQFEHVVQKLVETDNGETARLGRRLLEDILLPQMPEMKDNPEIYNRYQRLIATLKFMSLSARGLPAIQDLISKHLLVAVLAKVPLKAKFQDVLDIYDDIMMDGTIAEALGKAIRSSTEKLGTEKLVLKSGPVMPTLGNWVTDYFISTLSPTGQERIPGPVERISYINQNPNVRTLSKEQRDLLLQVLELYDWLRFGDSPSLLRQMFLRPRGPAVPPAPRPAVKNTEYRIQKSEGENKGNLPPPPLPSREATEGTARPGIRKTPPTPSPSPPQAGGEKGQEEDLYRSTLEELQKMRGEYEKKSARPIAPIPPRTQAAPKPTPSPGLRPPSPARGEGNKEVEYKPYSVNEAIIRGGLTNGENRGEIVSGNTPAPSNDKDVEEKLKKLEDKLK